MLDLQVTTTGNQQENHDRTGNHDQCQADQLENYLKVHHASKANPITMSDYCNCGNRNVLIS
jgi:hypothetical protein